MSIYMFLMIPYTDETCEWFGQRPRLPVSVSIPRFDTEHSPEQMYKAFQAAYKTFMETLNEEKTDA